MVVLLAGTGDHGYSRRAGAAAIPLARKSRITSIILESPYYGTRKPLLQVKSKLRQVSDLVVLGRATIEESCSLLRWLSDMAGMNNLAIAGVSMGGLHSAMTASLFPKSIGVVSWLGPPSAAPVFTDGLLANFCEWKRLQNDIDSKISDKQQIVDAKDAKDAMRQFLQLTDIDNFPPPVAPDRGIFVVADNDGYVLPNVSIGRWHEMTRDKWRGAKVLITRGGHVSATLFGGEKFRACVETAVGLRSPEDELTV